MSLQLPRHIEFTQVTYALRESGNMQKVELLNTVAGTYPIYGTTSRSRVEMQPSKALAW